MSTEIARSVSVVSDISNLEFLGQSAPPST